MSVENLTIPFPYVSVMIFSSTHTKLHQEEWLQSPGRCRGPSATKLWSWLQRAMTHRNTLISTAANNLCAELQMLPINISPVSPREEGGHSRRTTCVSESCCVNGKWYVPDLHLGGENRSVSPQQNNCWSGLNPSPLSSPETQSHKWHWMNIHL